MMVRRIALAALAMALLVAGCQSELVVLPGSLPDGAVGQRYEQTISVAQNSTPLGGVSVVDGALPAGLTLEKQAGDKATLAGTPTTAGTATFTIKMSCVGMNFQGGQTATKRYTLTIR